MSVNYFFKITNWLTASFNFKFELNCDTVYEHLCVCQYKSKKKSSMARSLPVENLLPQNKGSIINYLQ